MAGSAPHIAEKLEAAVVLDIRNRRMKDFFDLDWLSRHMEFDYGILRNAVQNTFARRGTALPEETPLALTAVFGTDASKQTQWNAFLRKNKLHADLLPEVIQRLHAFLHGSVAALPVIHGCCNVCTSHVLAMV